MTDKQFDNYIKKALEKIDQGTSICVALRQLRFKRMLCVKMSEKHQKVLYRGNDLFEHYFKPEKNPTVALWFGDLNKNVNRVRRCTALLLFKELCVDLGVVHNFRLS